MRQILAAREAIASSPRPPTRRGVEFGSKHGPQQATQESPIETQLGAGTTRLLLHGAARVAALLLAASLAVAASPGDPTLGVDFPFAGAQVKGLVEVRGTSSGASAIEVELTVGGTTLSETIAAANVWTVTLDTDLLPAGDGTLRATADGTTSVEHALVVTDLPAGIFFFGVPSSVDGATLMSLGYIPPGASGAPRPLVTVLHGKGEMARLYPGMQQELDARGWSALVPFGRRWGAFPKHCDEANAWSYVDHPFDARYGPCERDVLDALDAFGAQFPVDGHRVYLCGFSAGGMGAYAIGLKQPDRFAAIGPMAAPTDWYEYALRGDWGASGDTEACHCILGVVGGAPLHDPLVQTMYKLASARFLIENARNLPIFHAHGRDDGAAPNPSGGTCWRHADHLLTDDGWSGCHTSHGACARPGAWPNECVALGLPLRACFGHTPTLAELAAVHPGGYVWSSLFTSDGHAPQECWVRGSLGACADAEGEPSQEHTGVLGMFEFFAQHARVTSPDEVVFKTYTSEHRRAYWLELDARDPWSGRPAAVRARRGAQGEPNRVDIELTRAQRITLDVPRAGLSIGAGVPLRVKLARLVDPVFGDDLDTPLGALQPIVSLKRPGLDCASLVVELDGLPVPAALVTCSAGTLEIGPLWLDAQGHTLVVR